MAKQKEPPPGCYLCLALEFKNKALVVCPGISFLLSSEEYLRFLEPGSPESHLIESEQHQENIKKGIGDTNHDAIELFYNPLLSLAGYFIEETPFPADGPLSIEFCEVRAGRKTVLCAASFEDSQETLRLPYREMIINFLGATDNFLKPPRFMLREVALSNFWRQYSPNSALFKVGKEYTYIDSYQFITRARILEIDRNTWPRLDVPVYKIEYIDWSGKKNVEESISERKLFDNHAGAIVAYLNGVFI